MKNPPTTPENQLRVLLYKTGETWIAQCLEHDIAAQAPSIDKALKRFHSLMMVQARLDFKEGREPFVAIPRAPEDYWTLYSNAKRVSIDDAVPAKPTPAPSRARPETNSFLARFTEPQLSLAIG